jgi:hypothetical protein
MLRIQKEDVKMENQIVFQEDALTPEIICELSRSAGWPTTEPEDAKKAVAGTRYAVCAFDGDTSVGMARLPWRRFLKYSGEDGCAGAQKSSMEINARERGND